MAAKALHDAGDRIMARRQWRFTVARLDTEEIKGASVVAHRWGWHHDAIVTIARVKYWDDLDVRFPVVHERLVTDQARLNRIDSEWVYGVVRQESAFHARARSQVGALGLMQLMPGTARRVGRRLNLRVPSHRSILQVDNNIRLGTRYLRTVLDRAGGNPVVATAAYNAVPRKVEQWLPATGSLAADVWVESIPFNETRRFVKNVLAYTTVYQHRLGNHGPRLSSRMPTVSSRG